MSEGTHASEAHLQGRATGSLLRALLALCLALAAPALAAAQKPLHKDLPVNDPRQCPYCRGEAELMEAAGIVSHGGFEFAKSDTATVDSQVPAYDILWIETAHFQMGFALPAYKVPMAEKEKILGELARLREVLPDVPEKVRSVDPWLRAHLFAMRLEDHYQDFLTLTGHEEADFPPAGTTAFDPAKPFMGMGPYFGMAGKYEIFSISSQMACSNWLKDNFGLVTKMSQRWHITDRGTLIYAMHTQEGSLRTDAALHGNLVFNCTAMFVNGYRHYSYDKPIWLLEGLSHWFERRVDPEYNTFDSGEGAVADMTNKEDWEPLVRRMVSREEAISLPALLRMKGMGELTLEHHLTTWSLMDYMQRDHPGLVTKLLNTVCGLMDENLMPQGGKVPDATRDLFKDELGMSLTQFDRAWQAWVMETYASR